MRSGWGLFDDWNRIDWGEEEMAFYLRSEETRIGCSFRVFWVWREREICSQDPIYRKALLMGRREHGLKRVEDVLL